jgi:hypothetical protein
VGYYAYELVQTESVEYALPTYIEELLAIIEALNYINGRLQTQTAIHVWQVGIIGLLAGLMIVLIIIKKLR